MVRLLEMRKFVSFHVVSLFTHVSIGLAVSVSKQGLEKDDSLAERTLLSVDDVVDLLEFCIGATFMTFREKIRQQVHETAMGSLESVVVANLLIENIEQRALLLPILPDFGRDMLCRRHLHHWRETH